MAQEKQTCSFCRLPRAEKDCPLCQEAICRHCVETLPENALEMLPLKPEKLSHAQYCPRCFDSEVAPAREKYEEILARAKNVGYWSRAYRGKVHVLRKGLKTVQIAGCRDRGEALLKLGFLAAEQGFNGLIQGELVGKKVRNHGYQKTEWSGHALPCEVDLEKHERDEFYENHWRTLHHR